VKCWAFVLAGRLDPSPVLDLTVDLGGVPSGYATMDQRRAIKVLLCRSGSVRKSSERRTRIVIVMFGAIANESPTPSITDSEEKKQCKSAYLETAI
jgi:hypothetical protein